MPNTTCQKSYEEMLRRRQKHPLPHGLYKLREAQTYLERVRETVQEIERHEVHRLKYNYHVTLGCCVPSERGRWLKSVPNQLAEMLGYYVVPAIRALSGDGMSPVKLRRLTAYAEHRVAGLLRQCEEHRNRLKSTVRHEYDAMRHGETRLNHLLADVECLVDALAAAGQSR